jgi:putative PIN family toxin of toxin-antitoxin system
MRAVLDANVVISGIFWSGTPSQVLEAWMDDRFEWVVSESILSEYSEVLQRIAPKSKNPFLSEEWLFLIRSHTHYCAPNSHFKICRDPKDNKYLDCAFSGDVQALVSGDEDLLALKNDFPIKILSPKEFLKILS